MTKRCKNCRATANVILPDLNKKAIYLDQFMFSLIYNVKNGGNLPIGHEVFAKEVYDRLRRCVLLQQIVLPHSDMHHDETTVFHSANDLRGLYEFFGGDIGLFDRKDVELAQTISFAEAFFDGKEPEISTNVGAISRDELNEWLPDMHVGVNVDYGQFAAGIREARNKTHVAMENLAESWRKAKPSFSQALEQELCSISASKQEALARWLNRAMSLNPDNPLSHLESSTDPIFREYRALSGVLEKRGVEQDQQPGFILSFWEWEGIKTIPYHRISAYLFAAIARRVAMGEKR